MEKQYQSNSNSLLANHLPGIFNMMHILNMIVYGFVASQPAYFISALSSLQKIIRLSPDTQPSKKMLSSIRKLYYSVLAISVLLMLFVNGSAVNLVFVLLSLSLVCLGTQLYSLNKPAFRVNRDISMQPVTMQKTHLKIIKDKWFDFYHRYRITDLLAYYSLLLAAVS